MSGKSPHGAKIGGGSYLGISDTTDDQGEVSFDLSDGEYKFRADYLGYQFWSEIVVVPETLLATLSIPHQDVIITVENLYGSQTDTISKSECRVYPKCLGIGIRHNLSKDSCIARAQWCHQQPQSLGL